MKTSSAKEYTDIKSVNTLHRLRKEGKIHAIKDGQWRWDKESLDRFFMPTLKKTALDILRTL